MRIIILRDEDGQLYKDAYEEAQRIIRISEEIRISLERVTIEAEAPSRTDDRATEAPSPEGKLASSKSRKSWA